MRLVLASASPRRLALLRGVGLEPLVCPAGIPEYPLPGEAPEAYVMRLAREKAEAALAASPGDTDLLLIAADTEVVLDGEILGKPDGIREAAAHLRRLSGREHVVMTGLALCRVPEGRWSIAVSRTRIRFRMLDPALVSQYVRVEDVTDCAGAYRIQDRGVFLLDPEDGIQGSYSNVVGLPLERLFAEALRLGVNLLDT